MNRLTIIMPCFGRPGRTRRAINCILNQNVTNNIEVFVIGDGCPEFQHMVDTGETKLYERVAKSFGMNLTIHNKPTNTGGYGYAIYNEYIAKSTGKYLIFIGNDDIVLPNHVETYLGGVEDSDLDMAAYRTWVSPHNCYRTPIWAKDKVGHQEIIVKSSIAKTITTTPEYSHDWRFINNVLHTTKNIRLYTENEPTYIVRHTPPICVDKFD